MVENRPCIGKRQYSPELIKEHDEAIALANQAFALQDYQQCISFARRAIASFPSQKALELLYRVHIEKGLKKRAMEYRYLQALLEKSNLDIWQELLEYYSSLQGEISSLDIARLTISILKRIISIYLGEKWTTGPRGEELLHLQLYQASLLVKIGEASRAIRVYKKTLERFPRHTEATAELASLTYRLGNPGKAIECLDEYLAETKAPAPGEPLETTVISQVLHIASMRAEIHNETGKFIEAISSIEDLAKSYGISLFTTPTLFARWIVAKVLLSNTDANSYADLLSNSLDDTPQSAILDNIDLLYDTGNIFLKCNAPSLALNIFQTLLQHITATITENSVDQDSESIERPINPHAQTLPALHLGIACCHRDLHNEEEVEHHLQQVLLSEPYHVDTLCMLAEHRIRSCYSTANQNHQKSMSLIEEHRDAIIDLLSPKPQTDVVLSLKLMYQRARFYVFHDLTNPSRHADAFADLMVITEAVLRDAPVSTSSVASSMNRENLCENEKVQTRPRYSTHRRL